MLSLQKLHSHTLNSIPRQAADAFSLMVSPRVMIVHPAPYNPSAYFHPRTVAAHTAISPSPSHTDSILVAGRKLKSLGVWWKTPLILCGVPSPPVSGTTRVIAWLSMMGAVNVSFGWTLNRRQHEIIDDFLTNGKFVSARSSWKRTHYLHQLWRHEVYRIDRNYESIPSPCWLDSQRRWMGSVEGRFQHRWRTAKRCFSHGRCRLPRTPFHQVVCVKPKSAAIISKISVSAEKPWQCFSGVGDWM